MIPTDSQTRAWMTAWRASNDSTAGRALVEGLYPFVISLLRRHVADRQTAEDLAQQTFVKCFAKADQWQSDKPLEPWLARIALNLCRDHFRARRVRRELRWSDLAESERSALAATRQPAASDAENSAEDARALLLRLLDTLKADDRMVLSLIYLEEKSTDQVAELTGWSRTLVKVRAFRARAKLRNSFEKLEQSKP